jgi:hypothetical protein
MGSGIVAHACNPSYSGGRDQEDGVSRSTPAKSSQDPSQPMAEHSGNSPVIHLSKEAQIERSQFRQART